MNLRFIGTFFLSSGSIWVELTLGGTNDSVWDAATQIWDHVNSGYSIDFMNQDFVFEKFMIVNNQTFGSPEVEKVGDQFQ